MPNQPDLTREGVNAEIDAKVDDARARLIADTRVTLAEEVAKRLNAADGTSLTPEEGLGILAPAHIDAELTGVWPANLEALSDVTTVLSHQQVIDNLINLGHLTEKQAIDFVKEHLGSDS